MFGDVTARERTRRNEAELDILTRREDLAPRFTQLAFDYKATHSILFRF
jgi:hypothetical protein